MTQHKHARLDAFVSLGWYDTLLRFITNFIAKTSELLLAAGLVVSSANFLTDGTILGTTTPASQAWAWAQALAIDSSLAISFYHVLSCIKQRDWMKCVLYSLLTCLLAVVAGTITNIDIFSHAIHVPINQAMTLMGLNVELLSSLRSIAVVGFVLMSRLRDVSMKDLTISESDTHQPVKEGISQIHQHDQKSSGKEQVQSAASSHFTIEDVTYLLQFLGHLNGTTLTPIMLEPDTTQAHRTSSSEDPSRQLDRSPTPSRTTKKTHVDPSQNLAGGPDPDPSHLEHAKMSSMHPKSPQARQRHTPGAPEPQSKVQSEPKPSIVPERHYAPEPDTVSMDQDTTSIGREARLKRAYQELVAEGQKISGRTLAGRAHMHRSLCTKWLRTRQVQMQQAAHETNPSIPQEQSPEYPTQKDQDEPFA